MLGYRAFWDVLVCLLPAVVGTSDVDAVLDQWKTQSCPPTISPRVFADDDVGLRQHATGIVQKLAGPWRKVVHGFEEGILKSNVAVWAVTGLDMMRRLACGARFRHSFPDERRLNDFLDMHCAGLVEVLRMATRLFRQLEDDSSAALWSSVERECIDSSCGWGCPDMLADAVASLVPAAEIRPWKSQFFVPSKPLTLPPSVSFACEGLQSLVQDRSPPPVRAVRESGVHALWNRALSWEAILHMMFASGVPLSRTVLNLGAGGGDCSDRGGVWDDPANCLMHRGWWGVAFEADGELAQAMRDLNLPGVHVYDGIRDPAEVVAVVRAAGLDGPLDLLKIDVDNGDCFFLDALLSAGCAPLLIHMEVLLGSVPPPFAVAQRYNDQRGSEDVGKFAMAHHHRGCSLAAMASIAEDYFLVQVTHPPGDALWARKDALAEVLPGAGGMSLFDRWRLNFHCLPTRPVDVPGHMVEWASGPRADARVWADERLPVDVRFALVREYFERYSRGEVGHASLDMPAAEVFDAWVSPG